MPVVWIISNDGKGKRQSFTARSSLNHIGGNGEHSFSVTAYGATEEEARENADEHFDKLAEWINFCKGK